MSSFVYLSNSIYFYGLFCLIFTARVEGTGTIDLGDLSDWQELQLDILKSNFDNWGASILNNLSDEIVNSVKNECSKLTSGLLSLIRNTDNQVTLLKAAYNNPYNYNFNVSDAYTKLGKLREKALFLANEVPSGNDIDTCTEAFQRINATLQRKIVYFYEVLQFDMRKLEAEAVANKIVLRNTAQILLLRNMTLEDLEFVIGELFPGFVSAKAFESILAALNTLGGGATAEAITWLSLVKIKEFGLLGSPYTLQLAYVAKTNNATKEHRSKFPLQIQKLFWGEVNCIQGMNSKYLREDQQPLDEDAQQLGQTLITNVHDLDPRNITEQSCGWKLIHRWWFDGERWRIKFQLERTLADNREWRLSPKKEEAVLSLDSTNGVVDWEIIPTTLTRDSEDVVFSFRTVHAARNICQESYKEWKLSWGIPKREEKWRVKLLRNNYPDPDCQCCWQLVNIKIS